VRCFNHTLQLSVKTLLKPFNVALANSQNDPTKDLNNLQLKDVSDEESMSDDGEDNDDGDDYDDDDSDADSDAPEFDDVDNDIDELEMLPSGEKANILEQTSDVCDAIMKVSVLYLAADYDTHQLAQIRQLVFAIIRSTTIALPAWRRICHDHQLKVQLIPRDIVTRWNSMYDMLQFASNYRAAIDGITADKSLKLWKFELDNGDWEAIDDLVLVLSVRYSLSCMVCDSHSPYHSYTKKQLFSSRAPRYRSRGSSRQWTGLIGTSGHLRRCRTALPSSQR